MVSLQQKMIPVLVDDVFELFDLLLLSIFYHNVHKVYTKGTMKRTFNPSW